MLALKVSAFITPLVRLGLAIALVKVVSDSGGFPYLDALALATVHASFAVIPTLPWLTRLRAFLRHTGSVRRSGQAWAFVFPTALRSQIVFLAACALAATLVPGIFPKDDQRIIYALVLFASSTATSLVSVEYICGRLGLQGRLRLLELGVFILFAAVSMLCNSPVLAACAVYLSTLTVRAGFALVARQRGVQPGLRFALLSSRPAYTFLWTKLGWMVVFGNLAQCLASAAIYSYAFNSLAAGVVAQISLAYRFAGPMQLLSSQLAYVTWKQSDLKKGALLAVVMFVSAAALTLLLPRFFRDFLGLEPSVDAGAVGLVACAHIALQGYCQIKGSYLYSVKAYPTIALSAIPHACMAIAAPALIASRVATSPLEVILLLLVPTVAELMMISFIPRSRRG